MSLREQLDGFKHTFQSGKPPFDRLPPETHEVMRRATEALVASGIADRVVRSGPAPAFELPDAQGKLVRLSDLTAAGPVVLGFYRGAWCPYCNLELAELERHAAAVRAAGATLVLITPQTAANSRKLIADKQLSFPMLSDAGNEVAARYGLRFRMPDDLIALYRKLGVDLATFNGDATWTLPVPARFIIDRAGQIRRAEANPDYTQRPEPAELVPLLRELGVA